MLILDEADEMLSRGFKEQVYDIYRFLPPSTQVVVVSATLPHEVRITITPLDYLYQVLELTQKFTTNPISVLVKRDELTLEGIKQVLAFIFCFSYSVFRGS